MIMSKSTDRMIERMLRAQAFELAKIERERAFNLAREKRDREISAEYAQMCEQRAESELHASRNAKAHKMRTREILKRADRASMITDKRAHDDASREVVTRTERVAKTLRALSETVSARDVEIARANERARHANVQKYDDRSRYARLDMRALETASRAETISERDARLRREAQAKREAALRARRKSAS